MLLTPSELDELLRRADDAVTRLRRATLELADLGGRLMAARRRPGAAGSR